MPGPELDHKRVRGMCHYPTDGHDLQFTRLAEAIVAHPIIRFDNPLHRCLEAGEVFGLQHALMLMTVARSTLWSERLTALRRAYCDGAAHC
jgi:hypothetical protein